MRGAIACIEVISKMFFIIFMNEFGIRLSGVKKNGGDYLNLWAM